MEYGTSHPDKIDVIGLKEGKVVLTIIQSEMIDDQNILLFQEKLNNYLDFILGGQLDDEYLNYKSLPVVLEIILQHEPSEMFLEFLNNVIRICLEEGIRLKWRIEI